MSNSSFGFGTPAPEKVEAPKLASSGLSGFEHEVKLKPDKKIKVVVLHPLNGSFQINVHKTPVYDPGNGYRYVPVGSKNTHLSFLNPPVASPFETDPNPAVKYYKTARYMLVFVLESPDGKLNNHVAYLELRDNWSRKDGSYNIIQTWEEENGQSVEGRQLVYSRTGSGMKDTTYKTTILVSPVELTPEQLAVVQKEAPEVRDYILSLYNREWTTEEFTRLHGLLTAQLAEKERKDSGQPDPVPTHPVATSDDTEIPF